MLADLGLTVESGHADDRAVRRPGGAGGLAALLLSRFDVLLLDEPTNDLDLDGLARLESFVTGQRVGMVIVSHDREFLARCVTTWSNWIWPSSPSGSSVAATRPIWPSVRWIGGTPGRPTRSTRTASRGSRSAAGRNGRGWTRGSEGGPKAEGQRQDRPQLPDRTDRETGRQGPADRPDDRTPAGGRRAPQGMGAAVLIQTAPRSGSVVAVARGAVARRGDFTLGPVNLQVDSAIGSGSPGRTGREVDPAGPAARPAGTVEGSVRWVRGRASARSTRPAGCCSARPNCCAPSPIWSRDWAESEVRTLLAKFGLRAEHVLRPAISLSPGERTRAALALLQARGVNLLVLDEPTNHLDLPAIEQLEQALEATPERCCWSPTTGGCSMPSG